MKRPTAAAIVLVTAASAQEPSLRTTPNEPVTERRCGLVETFVCNKGTVTLHAQQPSTFRIVIPPEARRSSERRVEQRYVDRQVCVTGKVEPTASGDEVVVRTLDDITIEGESSRPAFAQHAYRSGCDLGVVMPTLLRERKPRYTRSAMEDRVQGVLWIDAVVEPTGAIGEMRVVKSLRDDLDAEALGAVEQWRFQPATYQGAPVALIVTIEMTFTLKK